MGVADLGEEAEEGGGGEFALARGDVAVAVGHGCVGDAVLVVDVFYPRGDFEPGLFGGFAAEFPGVVGVPDETEGLVEVFVEFAEVFPGGE